MPLLSVYLDRGVIPYDEGGGKVHAPSEDLSAYQEVRPGDFVLNNQQAWRGSVGISPHHGIISPAYLVYEPKGGLLIEYLAYLLRDKSMVDQYMFASRGVGDIQRQLKQPLFRQVKIIIPPIEEQRKIVDFVKYQEEKLDKHIDKLYKEIELIKEYKQSLIAEAVTGKIDVSLNNAASSVENSPYKTDFNAKTVLL